MSARLCHKTNFEPFLFMFGGKEAGHHFYFHVSSYSNNEWSKNNLQIIKKKKKTHNPTSRQLAM